MTPSHSKHSYEELVVRQDTETFIRCHENAFNAFNGAPETTVKLDNLKQVLYMCVSIKEMPSTDSDDIIEIIHRRYEVASTIIATNRPINDWGVLLGDNAVTTAILDRFLDKSYRLSNTSLQDDN